jgi:diaminopimelate epimerase
MSERKACETTTMASPLDAYLSKHHGLGNDFLVWLTESLPLDAPDRARRWCDRRTGIGADGLIFGLPVADGETTTDLVFRLFNSDGSPAAVSGNGLRCLAQAEARRRGVSELSLRVSTPAGVRLCTVQPSDDAHTVVASVAMGAATTGPNPTSSALMTDAGPSVAAVQRWETVDIGNPHVVCQVDDPTAIDLAVAGPAVEQFFPDGANVHFVSVTGNQELLLRVWERGAGITEACGTGATAAAAVFHRWGLVGESVRVQMPGGDVTVGVGDELTLTGQACHIADITVANA